MGPLILIRLLFDNCFQACLYGAGQRSLSGLQTPRSVAVRTLAAEFDAYCGPYDKTAMLFPISVQDSWISAVTQALATHEHHMMSIDLSRVQYDHAMERRPGRHGCGRRDMSGELVGGACGVTGMVRLSVNNSLSRAFATSARA